jgi:hypothetical protein
MASKRDRSVTDASSLTYPSNTPGDDEIDSTLANTTHGVRKSPDDHDAHIVSVDKQQA